MQLTIDESTFFWGTLGVIVLALVVAFVIVVFHLLRRGRSSQMDRAEIQRRWQKIELLAKNSDESSMRHAIIEADSIFDLAMKLKFFSGKDFGERLKTAGARYPRLREIWKPHKLRNQLVHEPGTALSNGTAQRAIRIYREGLRELGLL